MRILKNIIKKVIILLGLNVSDVGNFLGTINKNAYNIAKGGRSRIKYVNIGGGPFYKRGWGVLDYTGWSYSFAPGTVDWQHNLASTKPLPLKSNSICCFYSSHCLEHIPEKFHGHIASEISRCLIPGGGIRITTPDFDKGYSAIKSANKDFFYPYLCEPGGDIYQAFIGYFCRDYLKDKRDTVDIKAALESKTKEEFIDWVSVDVPEDYIEKNQDHVAVINFDRLKILFENAGLENVEYKNPEESGFHEMTGRGFAWVFNDRFPEGSLFVEATKPMSGAVP